MAPADPTAPPRPAPGQGGVVAATAEDVAPRRAMSEGRKRVLTGIVAASLVVAADFLLPAPLWLALCVVGATAAAVELGDLARRWAPSAPLRPALAVLVPVTAVPLAWALQGDLAVGAGAALLVAGLLVVLPAALVPLLARTDVRDAAPAIGFLAFGVPYFALPAAGLAWLQAHDPWLVFLLLTIVALGDTMAYVVGSRLGRHKMTPVVSPNKSWEGATASFLTAVGAAAVWSALRLGEVQPGLLAVGAATGVAAQLGDLVESLVKRGAGVKDSAQLLPGHGGFYDRFDAALLAVPVFVAGLWLLGVDSLLPAAAE